MKRDMRLVRDILLSIEAGTDIKSDTTTDKDIIGYHLQLMVDGGLLRVLERNRKKSYALSWEGYELLESNGLPTSPAKVPIKALPVGNIIKMEDDG